MTKISFVLLCALLIANQENAGAIRTWRTWPQFVGSFARGPPVYGIYQSLGTIYVISDSTPYIQTFRATGNNEQLKNISVNGMGGPYDMVGIAGQDLFILDWFDWANVTVVSLNSGNGVSRFSLQESTYSSIALSVSSSNNIIATVAQPQKIKEFTPTGQLVSEVYVNVTQPRHTIKLRSGNGYVMCHGYGTDQLHRVCLLNNAGVVQNCYGSSNGSAMGHLDVPARVLEDQNGNILVADLNNKRVVQLSAKLKYIKDLVTVTDGLQGPYRLMLQGSLLYVADNTVTGGIATSGRALVFNLPEYQN